MSDCLNGEEILPACDLCHSRKVKCDRRSICANCMDVGVECRRLRSGRSSRKRPLSGTLNRDEKVLNLEMLTSPSNRGDHRNQVLHTNGEVEQPPPRRQRMDGHGHGQWGITPESNPTPGADADGSNYHAIQAKSVIELELGDCRHISKGQQSILSSALQLVSQLAEKESVESGENEGDILVEDPSVTIPESPPPELLFLLLRFPSGKSDIRWPDHISNKTFERMATALIKGDCRGRLFHQYSVCIYVKAICYVFQLSRVAANATVKGQLFQSRKAYTAAALRSIKQFDILAPPSLSAIQSLISGSLLMQQLGDINICWILNSYAARQIAALGYQKVGNVSSRSEAQQEIHSAVYWCYYIDRTLSALLLRSPSFPEMAVSATELISTDSPSPYDPLIRILLDAAQIQGQLLALQSQTAPVSHHHVLDECRLLREKMEDIYPRLQSSRNLAPESIHQDWIAAEFCYYAIMVDIHRTRLRCSFTPLVHKECLACARRSLEALRFLLQHPGGMPGFDDPYPTFLTWTLFLYPLTPFFVLFCHIIGSLDQHDFDLTQDITKSLSRFKKHPHLDKVLRLLTSLEHLCEPLFQGREEASAQTLPLAFSVPEANNTGEALPSAVNPMMGEFGTDDADPRNPAMAHAELGPSADWLTWQMFDSQLPSGWLNVDLGLYGLNG
ncbi:hypothetical protein BO94DRAFT_590416 [Aspergillus sclerotioniger CBS 115572]|uniref:Zn(2)-C6 fungal-type domain-containing protein n=1 Tax=Aspergillus sclerotioniger CBS 115572 TaxID=1450535 RepID=A0A317V9T3_9EURO|nr:hypothetical protein BO94DRAFT_590416 [Aspergillus sclerotioniger CBS 115572]PWY69632.1 hypothetical protein BO94DRAFT_590416 [Aspergillus sclerotioniger CBS 115572]